MRIFEPSTVEPLVIDLRKVVWGGIAAWVVALVVVGSLTITGATTGRGVWICLVGIALGLWALLWERRHFRH